MEPSSQVIVFVVLSSASCISAMFLISNESSFSLLSR